MKKQISKQAKKASKLAKAENLKKKQAQIQSSVMRHPELVSGSHTITVKNAEGYPDTTAEIMVQNQIDYTPKVSVIIPVYNVEQYLRQCIDSVVNQTLKEIEIICVDDGSTDSSLEILKEYAKKDKRITVLKQENLYAGVARNAGLAVARGEYTHFLDSDDWINADTYKKLYHLIKEKQVHILKFRSYTYDDKKNTIIDSYLTNMGAINENKFNTFLKLENNCKDLINVSDAPWSGIYETEFLINNDILFDNLQCANDTSFFYGCITKVDKIYLSKERFVYYRINNSNSLIGIRAYHFDCQIHQFFIIMKMIARCSPSTVMEIRKHLIHAIFYRYASYLNNPLLDEITKAEIRNEVKEFSQHINIEEVDKEYIGYYQNLQYDIQLSIIIPVYNAELYLRKCLDSVVNQTLKDVEIICIDDGSIDNSLNIIKEYAIKDSRFAVISQKNIGSAAARNNAIKIVKGQYIGFIDADDYIDNNYYEKLLQSALKNNADISATSSCKVFNKQGVIYCKNMGLDGKLISSEEDKGKIIIKTGASCNKIYKKDFITRNKIHCLELKNAAEDNYFTDTAIIYANKISVINDVNYYYRINENSQTKILKDDKQFSMIKVYQEIDEFIKNSSLSIQSQKKFLEIMNIRKRNDFYNFVNTMDKQYIDKFRKLFLKAFPELKDIVRKIIISLTSYPARINTVNQTIETLLNQSTKADKIILWLAPEQFPNKEADLPKQLLDLRDKGLTIDWYHDIKSYKKLIPTLKKYPDNIIVTADDDILYPQNWVENLYKMYKKDTKTIYSHRIHKITLASFCRFKPYSEWEKSVCNTSPSFLNFCTTGGGVLYPPNCFHKDVLREDIFMKLCPTADDIWFWAMLVINNKKINIVQNNMKYLKLTDGTQETALWATNKFKNDEQLTNMLNVYPQILEKIRKEQCKNKLKSYLLFPYYLFIKLFLRQKKSKIQIKQATKKKFTKGFKINKQIFSLKLFNLPVATFKQRGGKKVWKLLGLPVWKKRTADNKNIKYYLFGIHIITINKKSFDIIVDQ